MCGIAGIVDLNGQRQVNKDALQRISDGLIHRGPDGDGLYTAPGIGLAHRRLSIIDLVGGAQPFHAQSGQHVLTYNGEIYNYQDLAKDLTQAGVDLKTRSDTEIIAEGLALYGVDFVARLQGMFAFAFWDAKTRSLLLVRDRLGEKPLYYGVTHDGFLAFASELTALMASGLFEKTLCQLAVADYFQYGYVPDPKSIYKNIDKLAPGHCLRVDHGKPLSPSAYWQLPSEPLHELSYEEASEALLTELDRSVRSQMMSDVPLGAFLSGGVDSSAIVAAMAQTGAPPVTCSIGFDEASYDERPFARQVAGQFNTHHVEEVATLDIAGLIDQVARAYGEPFADSSALPMWMVSKLARQHVTVALSGDGGDELFAGYRRYRFFLGEEKMRTLLPGALRKPVFGTAGRLYPKLDRAPKFLRFKTTFQALGEDQAAAYARASAIMIPERAHALLSDDFHHSLNGYNPSTLIRDVMDKVPSKDPLQRALHADMKTWLAGRMLVKTDRASMAHSLEIRPPMLDVKLVEWAARLPSAYKLHQGTGKHILKSALRSRLPDEILYRKKRGFDLPVSQWLKAETNNPLDRLKDSSHWKQSGILNTQMIETMMKDHQSGTMNYGQELWSVIMVDAFLENGALSA